MAISYHAKDLQLYEIFCFFLFFSLGLSVANVDFRLILKHRNFCAKWCNKNVLFQLYLISDAAISAREALLSKYLLVKREIDIQLR